VQEAVVTMNRCGSSEVFCCSSTRGDIKSLHFADFSLFFADIDRELFQDFSLVGDQPTTSLYVDSLTLFHSVLASTKTPTPLLDLSKQKQIDLI